MRIPSEYKQPGDKDDGTKHHWRQSRLWYRPVFVRFPSFDIVFLIQQICCCTEDHTKKHGQEG